MFTQAHNSYPTPAVLRVPAISSKLPHGNTSILQNRPELYFDRVILQSCQLNAICYIKWMREDAIL